MATYAWVITQDLDNPFAEDPDGFDISSRVGLSGPSAASEDEILRALNTGKFFQLLDDDGHSYYIGRCWWPEAAGQREMFGPLDDWARADVGATDIQYRVNGRWESL
jgi:hypothetical protein